ncbi:MAG: hypothetical protein KDB88_11960, partial [Flavobacteriales bacterium]|nr:hypothetical protein [Flavobacteriales bacterium]
MRSIFLLSPFLFLASTLHGQQYDLRVFTVEDGLPAAGVNAFAEDEMGYLWMATNGGVCRTDGVSFTSWSRSHGLPSDRVRDLVRAPDGSIYAFTDEGAARLYPDGPKRSPRSLRGAAPPVCAIADQAGRSWLATSDGSLYTSELGRTDWQEVGSPGSGKLLDLALDEQGTLWCATDRGVWLLRGSEWHRPAGLEHLDQLGVNALFMDGEEVLLGTDSGAYRWRNGRSERLGGSSSKVPGRVSCVLKSSRGDVLIGSDGLLLLMDGVNDDPTKAIWIREENGLGHNDVRSLYEDRSGAIWIGTAFGGASRFNGLTFVHFTTRDGLGSRIVSAVERAPDGTLWVGTFGGGVLSYDGVSVKTYGAEEGLSDLFVVSIGSHRDGRVLVGTAYSGLFFLADGRFHAYSSSFRNDRRISAIRQDEAGNVWFATSWGLFVDRVNGGIEALGAGLHVNALEVQGDTAWIGAAQGLFRVIKAESAWNMVRDRRSPPAPVTCLARDIYGELWVGTEGAGLVRLGGDRVDTLDVDRRMSSNYVEQLLPDAEGFIWAGTRRGLDRIAEEIPWIQYDVDHFGREHGFIGVEAFRNACMLDRDSALWFGTVRGLTRYKPQRAVEQLDAPAVHITGIQLFFEEPDWSDHCDTLDERGLPIGLVLPHNKNHLTFRFQGIRLSTPDRMEYSYQLEGANDLYANPSPRNEVTFSNLRPGDYTFRVIARSANMRWSEEAATFSFTILPPFYLTLPFQATAGGTLLFLFWGGVRLRTRKLRRDTERLEGMVRTRTRELAAEKERSENLLLNILPERTANELRRYGSTRPHDHPDCTVLFSDFKGFTAMSETMAAQEIVKELDRFFRAFDGLCTRYGTEKIKTIGDA